MTENNNDIKELRHGLTEEVSRFQEAWRIFRKNRMALWGLLIFILFFMVAVSGLDTLINRMIDKMELEDEALKERMKTQFEKSYGEQSVKELCGQMFGMIPPGPGGRFHGFSSRVIGCNRRGSRSIPRSRSE